MKSVKRRRVSKRRSSKSARSRPMSRSRSNQHTQKRTKIFKKDEFSSRDGFVTRVWGPPLWHVIHTMSFNYPVKPTAADKKHYREFILSLQHVLPCGACRTNFLCNLKAMPLTADHLQSRDSFSRYVYALHEKVNTMLKKTSGLTYDMVRERYEHFRARCNSSNNDKKKKETVVDKEIKGCTEPLYGIDTKCVLKIVPLASQTPSLSIDNACMKKRK